MKIKRIHVSQDAFNKIEEEKIRIIKLKRRNKQTYKYKRIDTKFALDKLLGIK